ncbi:hypothetical protein ABTL37_20015, partial [Acinetobacter baumannii]
MIIAAVFIILFSLIPISIGIKAKSIGIDISKEASVIASILKQKLNPFLFALISCAILAAIVSTAQSLLCGISSNLSQDF